MARRVPPIQPLSVAQQNRIARAAEKVGGYDKLIELERERREKLRREKAQKKAEEAAKNDKNK